MMQKLSYVLKPLCFFSTSTCHIQNGQNHSSSSVEDAILHALLEIWDRFLWAQEFHTKLSSDLRRVGIWVGSGIIWCGSYWRTVYMYMLMYICMLRYVYIISVHLQIIRSYMMVDQNSFIRERPFFARIKILFRESSRTPCLKFRETHVEQQPLMKIHSSSAINHTKLSLITSS